MPVLVNPAAEAGAYVSGVDLNDLDSNAQRAVRDSLGQYGVLFFRDQSLTPEGHITLAEKFGAININRFFQSIDDYPQIAQVLKEPEQKQNLGEMWHTDHSYDQIPALGSILVARELPASGGDTMFVSMFAAYDALSEKLKNRVEGLTAVHSSRHVFGKKAYTPESREELTDRLGNTEAATQDAVHPLVVRHPISGKRAIYVNPQFTVKINELPEIEGNALLEELYAHCQNEEFIHRFQWHEGSVVFWDNRATWHKALNDYMGERRLMHRITIEGDALSMDESLSL